jgi:serine/threonine protein kinase
MTTSHPSGINHSLARSLTDSHPLACTLHSAAQQRTREAETDPTKRFKLEDTLGKGAFATVYRAVDKSNKTTVVRTTHPRLPCRYLLLPCPALRSRDQHAVCCSCFEHMRQQPIVSEVRAHAHTLTHTRLTTPTHLRPSRSLP